MRGFELHVSRPAAMGPRIPRMLLPNSTDSSGRPARRLPRSVLWLTTAAMAGAIIMVLELAAFRVYAPYFGYSSYVWGSIIAVALAALTGGYSLGLWLAERARTDRPLYAAILASAAYQFAVLYTIHSLLSAFARLGELAGASLATLLLFAPPMAALAIVGPFVIRLLARSGYVGLTSARVHALATGGSIAGILLAALLLIPYFGIRATLGTACLLSVAMGIAGLLEGRYTVLAALAVACLIPVARRAPVAQDTPVWTMRTSDDFALGPLLAPAHHILVMGADAGNSIRATRLTAPLAEFEAVQPEARVVESSANPVRDDSRVAVHISDARLWLARSTDRFDIVHLNLFQTGPNVPFYLLTEEFFDSIRGHMTPSGLLMMNVFDISEDQEMLMPVVQTLKQSFSTVTVLPRESGNFVVLGFARPYPLDEIRAKLQSVRGKPFRQMAKLAALGMMEINPPAGTMVFTDDHAPVEAITHRMLVKYREQRAN